MHFPPHRDAALRQQLAQRIRTLRQWAPGRHRVYRDTEERQVAMVRVEEGSLGHLLRSVLSGHANLTPAPAQPESEFVEVGDACAVDSFQPPAYGPLSQVLAHAEARGLDLDTFTVHVETHKEPYEDWMNEMLVACDRVPRSDEQYAQAVEEVWHDYQQSLLAEQQDRDDYATFVRLKARFGHLDQRAP